MSKAKSFSHLKKRPAQTMNTTTSSTQNRELLSALADGELASEECTIALQACQDDELALPSWNAYHLIGEVLRSPAAPTSASDSGFLDRLNQRLLQEQALGRVAQSVGPDSAVQINGKSALEVFRHDGVAANDGSFRWKLVAGVASLAAVSAIAWNAAGLLSPASAPQLALAPALQQVLVASPQGPMVRDARLEELLAAHKQLGGASALQVPSGFLQNATFETPRNVRR